jgi:hypothetical protein
VLASVRLAGLASEVARLKARFVIKDADDSLSGCELDAMKGCEAWAKRAHAELYDHSLSSSRFPDCEFLGLPPTPMSLLGQRFLHRLKRPDENWFSNWPRRLSASPTPGQLQTSKPASLAKLQRSALAIEERTGENAVRLKCLHDENHRRERECRTNKAV